ncbi:MAG: heat shock protein transcriptional repressor HspR [Anaerolineae bacterium]
MAGKRTRHEPIYAISVVSRMVDLHPQTLRHYENLGLVKPTRSGGNRRLYSEHDLERLRLICRLTNDLGVNLAAVEVILNLTEQIQTLREEMEEREAELQTEVARLSRLLSAQSRSKLTPFMPPLPPGNRDQVTGNRE